MPLVYFDLQPYRRKTEPDMRAGSSLFALVRRIALSAAARHGILIFTCLNFNASATEAPWTAEGIARRLAWRFSKLGRGSGSSSDRQWPGGPTTSSSRDHAALSITRSVGIFTAVRSW